MSTTTIAPASHDDGFDDFEFGLIVADFDASDETAAGYRPSKAAERREWRQKADAERGFPRHRTHERRD